MQDHNPTPLDNIELLAVQALLCGSMKKQGFQCKVCGLMCTSAQQLGGHQNSHRNSAGQTASKEFLTARPLLRKRRVKIIEHDDFEYGEIADYDDMEDGTMRRAPGERGGTIVRRPSPGPTGSQNPRTRPTNNQLLYKAYFRWEHYPHDVEDRSLLVDETSPCASVTSAFLKVLLAVYNAECQRKAGPRNVLQLLAANTRRSKVVELSAGAHRVPEDLRRHTLEDEEGLQYSTNLDRNRYGNDDNYLFTVIKYDLEYLGMCPALVDVEIIDAKLRGKNQLIAVPGGCCCCGGDVGRAHRAAALAARSNAPVPVPALGLHPAAAAAAAAAPRAAGPFPVPASGMASDASSPATSGLLDALVAAAGGADSDARANPMPMSRNPSEFALPPNKRLRAANGAAAPTQAIGIVHPAAAAAAAAAAARPVTSAPRGSPRPLDEGESWLAGRPRSRLAVAVVAPRPPGAGAEPSDPPRGLKRASSECDAQSRGDSQGAEGDEAKAADASLRRMRAADSDLEQERSLRRRAERQLQRAQEENQRLVARLGELQAQLAAAKSGPVSPSPQGSFAPLSAPQPSEFQRAYAASLISMLGGIPGLLHPAAFSQAQGQANGQQGLAVLPPMAHHQHAPARNPAPGPTGHAKPAPPPSFASLDPSGSNSPDDSAAALVMAVAAAAALPAPLAASLPLACGIPAPPAPGPSRSGGPSASEGEGTTIRVGSAPQDRSAALAQGAAEDQMIRPAPLTLATV